MFRTKLSGPVNTSTLEGSLCPLNSFCMIIQVFFGRLTDVSMDVKKLPKAFILDLKLECLNVIGLLTSWWRHQNSLKDRSWGESMCACSWGESMCAHAFGSVS